jgi:hypothetical protein
MMKVLYIDCKTGLAGDMLMSALLGLFPNNRKYVNIINELGIPGVKLISRRLNKYGINGINTKVIFNGMIENEKNLYKEKGDDSIKLNSFGEVKNYIHSLSLSEKIIKDTIAVLNLLWEAESYVHGKDIKNIHNSRLGTMDAIIDILTCCVLIDELNPDYIIASPVCTGYGRVKCRKGTLPIPAPATAYLLRKIPYYKGGNPGEFCTPTGVALIKYFSDCYRLESPMKNPQTGYGIGTRDFGLPSGVHVYFETVPNLCN